jgi:hypothetical protein
MHKTSWVAAATTTVLIFVAAARADTSPQAGSDALSRPRLEASASAKQGLMLPSLVAADTSQTTRVTGTSWAGYDAARSSFVLRTFVDANVYGPLALRAGVSYLPDSLNSSAQPHVGARVQLLRQAKHGLDLGLGAFYRMERFTQEEGLIQAMITAGYRHGRTGLFANLVYGQDAEGDDEEGEVLFALLQSVHESIQVGFEARGRFKLASSDEKRRQMPLETADLALAPTFSYALGPVAFLAQAGAAAIHVHAWRVGALAMAGLASSY